MGLTPPSSLVALSAALGADPALVQGAGGNTSEKIGDLIWVKASGALLSEARRAPIFLPLELATARAAAASGAEKFAIADPDGSFAGLRPSIETALHVLLPHQVVAHTHCVSAIAHAARKDAEAALARRLDGLAWTFVPYARPGAPLARSILSARAEKADILILGNHGLVVGADDAASVLSLTREVARRLERRAAPQAVPDDAALAEAAADPDWIAPLFPEIHSLAFSPNGEKVCAGPLYPDHVVFLGPGATPRISVGRLRAFLSAQAGPFPALVVIPGRGALMRKAAPRGAHEMARCLALVAEQVDPGAALVYLDDAQQQDLLSWDAEAYRQALERTRNAG